MIPYGRQDIDASDIEAVVDVLKSDWLTQGPQVPRFEHEVAKYVAAQQAVAVNSATSALHLACLALGLGEGDWLWTSPITFVASANCGLYCGAKVDFVDIDPLTYNLSVQALTYKLEQAEKKGCLPKVLIPVHFAGQSCDMRAIKVLADKYGFKIIEDASHAIGGVYEKKYIGNCHYSDITVFSFHPVKIVTTGEGGMAVTNREDLACHMRRLRSHGVTREPSEMTRTPDGPWYYEQSELGFNYRMTDMQAALGINQLQRLTHYIQRRNELALLYERAFSALPVAYQKVDAHLVSAYHLYVIRVSPDQHLDTFNALRQANIGVNLHYIPVHLQPYYQKQGFEKGMFPEAEQYYREAISLPMYPTLSDEQHATIIEHVARQFR